MVWKPVYAVPLKSVGGVEAPCCCLSFAGAPHSGRPMLIGLQDGDIVSGSYSRSDATQVNPKFSTSYLWLHQSTPQVMLPRAELGDWAFNSQAVGSLERFQFLYWYEEYRGISQSCKHALSTYAVIARLLEASVGVQGLEGSEADKAAVNRQQAHSSGVAALVGSPFFDNLVLSVGGWDWALWQADRLEAPLIRSATAPCAYTCVAWSPTRPGVTHLYRNFYGHSAARRLTLLAVQLARYMGY